MGNIKVYFSDFFEVDEDIIEEYGAINISLINDLPLFIDPFLLFNSENPDFQKIHKEMIDYLSFLQDQAEKASKFTSGMKKAWFSFPEVKQTWLGFSLSGNDGCGMGNDFANILNNTFKEIEDITDVHQMTNQQLKRLIQKIEVDKEENVDIYLRLLGDLGLDESVLIEENETVLNCDDQT